MEIVAGMVRAGAAQIVMGNHEFNALCYHTPDGKGRYLRARTKKNCAQHAETLRYFKKNPRAKDLALAWFLSTLAGSQICADRSRRVVAGGYPISENALFNIASIPRERGKRSLLVPNEPRHADPTR
jgi:hypothetical protein